MLILFAAMVTIVELFVARYMIKKFEVGLKQSLFTSFPFIVIVWVVAIAYT